MLILVKHYNSALGKLLKLAKQTVTIVVGDSKMLNCDLTLNDVKLEFSAEFRLTMTFCK